MNKEVSCSMGSFANTVFSFMLGWLQTVTSVIWSALTDRGGESFFDFLGNNWIYLMIVLCAAGLIVDFTVYIFRWRPYKVWLSFLHRIKKKNEKNNEDDEETDFLMSFSGENHDYDILEETITKGKRKEEQELGDDHDVIENTYDKAVMQNENPYRNPAYSTNDSNNTEHTSDHIVPQRRRRLVNLLVDSGTEDEYRYIAPKPPIEEKDAYHKPVYPERWQRKSEEDL